MLDVNFWLNNACAFTTLFLVSYFNGVWVKTKGVKVNYTRKINHFTLFLSFPTVTLLIPYEKTLATSGWGIILTLLSLAIYARPIRSRVPFIATMFMSFDRPEDRPYTLLWLITQFIASYLVLIPLGLYLHEIDRDFLIFIPILINGIGDGLAEPVGIRFGRHHYRTQALFSKRQYTRSLEGSACVFISGVIAILLFAEHFNQVQLIVALITIPLLMTLAEAFSPHTWDSPFLYLTGGLSIIFIDRLPYWVPITI